MKGAVGVEPQVFVEQGICLDFWASAKGVKLDWGDALIFLITKSFWGSWRGGRIGELLIWTTLPDLPWKSWCLGIGES
jgi:hypothetical protein